MVSTPAELAARRERGAGLAPEILLELDGLLTEQARI
jgi:hypothetical protein